MQPPATAPFCLSCRHYYVSWDPRFPRGCRVFGIKSRDLPSHVVYRSTGTHCPAYERNPKLKRGHPRQLGPGAADPPS
ncbi:MAG: hypothetical protein JW820_20910 [Spirochaetales bacterium]|nr:hypothetical protein [Spirochaetales bacterium]